MASFEQMENGFTSGDINAAFMDIAQAMYLFNKGMSIAMLMFIHRAGSRIIVPEQVQRLADFRGKSVLIPHRLSIQHMLVHRMLGAGKLKTIEKGNPVDSVGIEAVPYGLMPEMAGRDHDGDIAAFICPAPFGDTAVEEKGFRHLLISRDLWKDHPGAVFVVHQDLLTAKQEDLALMVGCLLDSARQLDRCMSSPASETMEVKNLAAAFLRLSAAQTQRALETSGITFNPQLLVPDEDILRIVLEYMSTTMKVMPAGTNLNGFIRPELIRTALSEN